MTRDPSADAPSAGPDDELGQLLRAVRHDPASFAAWDAAEEAAEERPDDVAALYRWAVLEDLPKETTLRLAERAVRFFNEWGVESEATVAVLERALDVDPSAAWAFHKLSLLYTVERRYADLLAQYDRALGRLPAGPARTTMLTEAARVAADLAGSVEKASGYLDELSRVMPDDGQVAQSLERLLRRQGRWEDLVALWGRRLDGLAAEEASAVRLQMAECLLGELDRPGDALPIALRLLLADDVAAHPASALLERIFAAPSASATVASRALEALRAHYTSLGRTGDVLRLLGAALGRAEGAERVELYRDMGEILSKEGQSEDALPHYAALLRLEPTADNRAKLRQLAESLGRLDRYASALAEAAEGCADRSIWAELLAEAARVRRDEVGDKPGAAELWLRIFRAPDVADEAMADATLALDALLSAAAPSTTLLDVLERRVSLARDDEARRALAGRAALLAEGLGDVPRALGIYRAILAREPLDRPALSASVLLLEQAGRWAELVEMLELSAKAAPSSDERRAFRARAASVLEHELADPQAAIVTWSSIVEELGADDAAIDALASLYEQVGDPASLAITLQEGLAIAPDPARQVALHHRIGEVLRQELADGRGACGSYEAALALSPGHPGARAGLVSLLEDDAARAGAVAALVRDFAATGDTFAPLDILEHRLTVEPEGEARAAILVEAADLEQRRGDALAATLALARAIVLSPNDSSILEALLAAAEATGEQRLAAEAVEQAGGTLPAGPRAAELAIVRGELLERSLGDARGGLVSYKDALALDPSSLPAALAAVRCAARLGEWSDAAHIVAETSVAQNAIDPSLPAALAAAARSAGQSAEAAAALEEAVATVDLPRPLVGELERTVARWYSEDVGDLGLAERALSRALAREGQRRETLEMLADVQRRGEPGRSFVETLVALSKTVDDPMAALREAATVALDRVGDTDLAEPVLTELRAQAAARVAAEGEGSPSLETVLFAVEELVRIAAERGEHPRAVELLVSLTELPLGADAHGGALLKAALLAEERIGDSAQAVVLLRRVLESEPDSVPALRRLGSIFAREGRDADLLALRQHELSRATDTEQRLTLRLAIAELLGRIGREDERVEVLFANLSERAAHRPSLERIEATFRASGELARLAALFEAEAARLEEASALDEAAELWASAAELAETSLADAPRALAALDRAVAAAATPAMFDALARIHRGRGDHAQAVSWLEKRLEATGFSDEDARVDTIAKLAEALALAGRPAEARACLEHARGEHPRAARLRDELCKLYRSAAVWDRLVTLLVAGIDGEASLVELREAADVCLRRLSDPARAVPILETMIRRAPEDRGARLTLATLLRREGELEQARELLTTLVGEYGRRRPPERAEAHYELGRVSLALGDTEGARAQLELAVSVSPEYAAALGALGELCLDAGDVERAERVYGTLMLLVMRTDADAGPHDSDAPSYTEVMLGLYRTLGRRGDTARAEEMLSSAFEAAARSDEEAVRLETALRRAGEDALLLRALAARVTRSDLDEPARAAIESERARVLERLGRSEEALDAWLAALALDPETPEVANGARDAARRSGASVRYVDTLADVASRARGLGLTGLAAATLLAMAVAIDGDLGEPTRALAAYHEAQELGIEGPEIWRPLSRLSALAGDLEGEILPLRRLVSSPDADETVLTEDLYRLAELELQLPSEIAAGLTTLEWAMGRTRDHGRAAVMLRAAAARTPDDGILELYERVARASGDRALLLDALTRISEGNYAPVEKVREAVGVASELGENAAVVVLLRRAVELGSQDSTGLTPTTWALVALADRAENDGDFAGAVDFLQRAAETADTDEAVRLTMRIAAIATERLDSALLGAEAYARLVERGLSDRDVWDALLGLTRRVGDRELLDKRLIAAIDAAFDPAYRNRLRMERAKLLFEQRPEDAASELRQLVDEDDAEAVDMLSKLYEREGDRAAQADLLEKRLASAVDRGEAAASESLALRLGELLGPTRPDDAVDAYRRGLDASPKSVPLLQRLMRAYEGSGRSDERAAIMDRLLELTHGEDAATLALELAKLYEGLGDPDAMARALERGFTESPRDAALRDRLLAHLRETEQWERLAEMRVTEGRAADGTDAVAPLEEAVSLYAERLERPLDAAATLGVLLDKAGPSPARALERARLLHAGGQSDAARQVLDDMLAAGGLAVPERVLLLRRRAEVAIASDALDAAAADLEAAFDLDPKVATELVECLELQWSRGERTSELLGRFVEVLLELDRVTRARDLLDDWLGSHPDDVAALKRAIDLDLRAKDWDRGIELAQRLVKMEPPAGKPGAAVLLARACEEAGRPEAARAGLELALQVAPSDDLVRERLRAVYKQLGVFRDLAQLELLAAQGAPNEEARHLALREAGRVFLEQAKDPQAALAPLSEVAGQNPRDHLATVYLADAYTALGRLQEAANLLDGAIGAHKGRRSPRELALLQQRMAHIANAVGDSANSLAWLAAAHESDVQNGPIAAELSETATQLGQFDLALKALRAITLMKSPEPVTRAMAYLRQAFIARHQGDARRALMLAKKAALEDTSLSEASDLVAELSSQG